MDSIMGGSGFGITQGNAKKDDSQLNDALQNMRDISRRLRILEERYSVIRKSIHVNEENMVSESKRNTADMKVLSSEITEVKKILRATAEETKQIIKELKETVKKEEIKVLEKYISLWQPMSFVTYAEMDKRIKEIVKEELKTKGL